MESELAFRLNLECLNISGLPVLVEEKPHAMDETVRRVERGSRIVVAVRQDTKLVLQVKYIQYSTIYHSKAYISITYTDMLSYLDVIAHLTASSFWPSLYIIITSKLHCHHHHHYQ
jgi:hypothetical protein